MAVKFTKTQYEHMATAFQRTLGNVLERIGTEHSKALTTEEKVGMIQRGEAVLDLNEVYRSGGSCSYAFEQACDVFVFPGDDVRMAQDIKAIEMNQDIDSRVRCYLDSLLDRYVLGALEAEVMIEEWKKLEAMTDDELRRFVLRLPPPNRTLYVKRRR